MEPTVLPPDANSRSPQGERGLKFPGAFVAININSRSPQGERGLKYVPDPRGIEQPTSLSARRAWIEIRVAEWASNLLSVALRKESVD